jgi:hypothetical protein
VLEDVKLYLVEAVHVELPDERTKVAVFEEAGQELFTEPVGRGNCCCVHKEVSYWGLQEEERAEVGNGPKNESPSSLHLIKSSVD